MMKSILFNLRVLSFIAFLLTGQLGLAADYEETEFDQNAEEQNECSKIREKMMKQMQGQGFASFSASDWILTYYQMLDLEAEQGAHEVEEMLCHFGQPNSGLGWAYGTAATLKKVFKMGPRNLYILFVAEEASAALKTRGYEWTIRMGVSTNELSSLDDTNTNLTLSVNGKGASSKGFARVVNLYEKFSGYSGNGSSVNVIQWDNTGTKRFLRTIRRFSNGSSAFSNSSGSSSSAIGIARGDFAMEAEKKYDSETGDFTLKVNKVSSFGGSTYASQAVAKGNYSAKTATVCMNDMSSGLGGATAGTNTSKSIPTHCYNINLDADGYPNTRGSTLTSGEKTQFANNNSNLQFENSANDLRTSTDSGKFSESSGGKCSMGTNKAPSDYFSKTDY